MTEKAPVNLWYGVLMYERSEPPVTTAKTDLFTSTTTKTIKRIKPFVVVCEGGTESALSFARGKTDHKCLLKEGWKELDPMINMMEPEVSKKCAELILGLQ